MHYHLRWGKTVSHARVHKPDLLARRGKGIAVALACTCDQEADSDIHLRYQMCHIPEAQNDALELLQAPLALAVWKHTLDLDTDSNTLPRDGRCCILWTEAQTRPQHLRA